MTENEARQMEVEIEWNGKANVCTHCGKVPETYYIATGHDHTDDSIRYCFCRVQAETIEQLQAKNAELTAEVEEQRSDHLKLVEENHELRQQRDLAVSTIENLVKQKGRHNTEIAYKKLVETLDAIKESEAK